jgi:undecaprenyl-diphosphatase
MLLATFLLAAVFLLAWGGIHVMLPLLWRVFFRLGRGLARLAFGPQRLARWSEHGILGLRPPRHPYRRVVLIGLCGFLAAAVVGAGFLALGEEVRESSASLQRMDHHVWELARSHRSPGRTLFFTAFTLLGTPVGLGAVVALATGALYTRGFRRLPLFVIVSTLGAWGIDTLLKLLFARARPDLTLAVRTSSGYSFPSGHAMMSLVTFGALVYALLRASDRRAVQSVGAAAALTAVLAISVSRVYLGVHWISDIAGGWAAGLLWLATSIAAYEVLRRLRLIRAGTALPTA